ncbi:hypothetical protein N7445_006346 [Penicillium cf. griseofulvum]|nr:hypothetical protein N7445_006346 [Penicillium cf. griseofulvum]
MKKKKPPNQQPNAQNARPGKKKSSSNRRRHQRYNSMHHNPRYSDLTIVCGGNEYHVRKYIVCPRSDFFAKVCDNGFQESSTNRVARQKEPVLVRGMIEYLYYLDHKVPPRETDVFISLDNMASDTDTGGMGIHSEPPEDTVTTLDPISVHILMYSPADRMLTEGLKLLPKGKVEQELGQRLIPGIFTHAMTQIYNSTHESERGLRDMVIRATMDNFKELRTAIVPRVFPPVFPDSLVISIPQFSSDLAVAMVEKTVSDWERHGQCTTDWRSPYY